MSVILNKKKSDQNPRLFWFYYLKQRSRAKFLLFVMMLQTFAIPCSNLLAHSQDQQILSSSDHKTVLNQRDLFTILSSHEPLVYLGQDSKKLFVTLASPHNNSDINDMCSIVPLSVLEKVLTKASTSMQSHDQNLKTFVQTLQKLTPLLVTITHNQTKQ